jgi:hypothetical protein
MANVLKREKQVAVIAALVEGTSVRSIERMTGVHRDTIIRLMARVAKAGAAYSDATLRDLDCRRLELDGAFVSRKQRRVDANDADRNVVGDQYTFVALDPRHEADSVLARGEANGRDDTRLRTRRGGPAQESGAALCRCFEPYVGAARESFGHDVDFGADRKVIRGDAIGSGAVQPAARRFDREGRGHRVPGPRPRLDLADRETAFDDQNAGAPAHQIDQAFSKRLANLRAAMDLHFTHYNFVRFHGTIRRTPAREARIVSSPMTVGGSGRHSGTTDVERLRTAIRDLHGVEATHLRTEPVHETFRGETVWDGVVEVFAVRGHPKAGLAYAWSDETDEGGGATWLSWV